MARYFKNTQVRGGDYVVQMPMGSSSLGGKTPVDGLTRFNTDSFELEYFAQGAWNSVAKQGRVPVVLDQYTGDQFDPDTYTATMSLPVVSETDILVFAGGVYQQPIVAYITDGDQLTLTSQPPTVDAWGNPNKIVVIHNLNSTAITNLF